MDVHQNAKNTPSGRRLIVQRLAAGWTIKATAAAFGVTAETVRKWQARHALQGEAGLVDRTSRPRRSPTRLDDAAVAEILALRRQRLAESRHRPPARPARLDREPHPASPRARPARRPRPQAHDRPLPARAARRAGPHRHQEAGEDRWYRPSHHRQPRQPGARRRLGLPARLCRRRLAPRLHRDPARRAERERRGLPQAGLGLVRHARRRGRARHDRQRLRLPQPSLPRRLRDRPRQAQAHPTLHAKDQRQGGTVHPDLDPRMGLPAGLHQLGATRRRHAPLAARLQPTPTPFSPWRKPTLHPADQGQPPW